MSVAYVVAGAVGSAVATEYARNNIYNVQFAGGDLVYSLAGSVVALTVIGGNMGRMLSIGMVAGGATSELNNMGVL